MAAAQSGSENTDLSKQPLPQRWVVFLFLSFPCLYFVLFCFAFHIVVGTCEIRKRDWHPGTKLWRGDVVQFLFELRILRILPDFAVALIWRQPQRVHQFQPRHRDFCCSFALAFVSLPGEKLSSYLCLALFLSEHLGMPASYYIPAHFHHGVYELSKTLWR